MLALFLYKPQHIQYCNTIMQANEALVQLIFCYMHLLNQIFMMIQFFLGMCFHIQHVCTESSFFPQ